MEHVHGENSGNLLQDDIGIFQYLCQISANHQCCTHCFDTLFHLWILVSLFQSSPKAGIPSTRPGFSRLHPPWPWAVPGMRHPVSLGSPFHLFWGFVALRAVASPQISFKRKQSENSRGQADRRGIPCAFFSLANEKKKVNYWDLGFLSDDPQPPASPSAPSSYLIPAASISESLEIWLHLVLSDGKIVYHRQGRQGSVN